MGVSLEYMLAVTAILLLLSLVASFISVRTGIPALFLFLLIGMLAGSEGLGGIHFDNVWQAQVLGVIALAFILFDGGISTRWQDVRANMGSGLALSTVAVVLTVLLMAWFATFFGFTYLEGALLGAIVSSTDAAAVFSVLRSKSLSLKGRLKPLLELESGSNDPMAVFLTLGLIQLLQQSQSSLWHLFPVFVLQMTLGSLMGIISGKAMVYFIRRCNLGYEGLYPVFSITMVLLTYSLTSLLHGNGFLAVYIAALILGNEDFIYKKNLVRFHDGLAWLVQIAMFVTLGLLVFPNEVSKVIPEGLMLALFLVFLARPISVFLTLHFSGLTIPEKTFISWVGLRGAVPIVLATYPLAAGVPHANLIFNLVFFIVITSVLLQGTTIAWMARKLGVNGPPAKPRPLYPIELVSTGRSEKDLVEVTITDDSPLLGRMVKDMGLPQETLVVVICRDDEFLIPKGDMVFHEGDTVLMLTNHTDLQPMCDILKTCHLPEL